MAAQLLPGSTKPRIRQSLNVLARKNGPYLLEYGHPFGYLPLREHLAQMLAELGITASAGQILLTQGTSQALELRDPGYLLKLPATRRWSTTLATTTCSAICACRASK